MHSEPKTSYTVDDSGTHSVRNSDVVVNHNSGGHDTMWSNSSVNGQTGAANYNEGAHGPDFKH
ncbi:MAG: hypothetical protein JST50_09940 [Bacteroidetes bacterium]|nr:hypothetical protein [Bacteroidota bacterium]